MLVLICFKLLSNSGYLYGILLPLVLVLGSNNWLEKYLFFCQRENQSQNNVIK